MDRFKLKNLRQILCAVNVCFEANNLAHHLILSITTLSNESRLSNKETLIMKQRFFVEIIKITIHITA